MKITKTQLKQIIKEELDEIRASGLGTFGAEYPDLTADLGPGGETQLKDAVKQLGQIILELRNLHDSLPNDRRVQFQKKMIENVIVLNSQLDAERAEKEHRNVSYGEEALEERELTKKEKKQKEKVVKGMKRSKKDFKKRYGADAESVMYATATKMAKKKKE